MSETKLLIPKDTVRKLKSISKKFKKLNTGAVGDNFWIGSGSGGGGYDWEQFDIGVNKSGELISCRQSGCSCNSPEEPYASVEVKLGAEQIEIPDDQYDESGKEAVEDLIATTDTLYKVLNSKDVSPKEIIALPNSEVRRAVIELVGYDKLVETASVLDESEDGELLEIPLVEDENIMLVHVKDPSTDREYYLRVPPTMKTAREARAWTFGFNAEDFVMEVES